MVLEIIPTIYIILGTLVLHRKDCSFNSTSLLCYSSILASKQAILEGLEILDDKEILKKIIIKIFIEKHLFL